MEDRDTEGAKGEASSGDYSIRDALAEVHRKHSRWAFFWLAFFILLTAVLVVVYCLAGDEALKHAVLIGFIGSSLGVVGVFISPLTGDPGKGRLHPANLNILYNPLESASGSGDTGGSDMLRSQELEIIRERAAQESEARHWANRSLSIVVVTVLSLILWLVFHEPLLALGNQVIALGITQAQYYSHPKVAMRVLGMVGERGE